MITGLLAIEINLKCIINTHTCIHIICSLRIINSILKKILTSAFCMYMYIQYT